MTKDIDVLKELENKGVLFLKDGDPVLFNLEDGTKLSFLQFKNSEITHEESQNHFSVYYTRIEKLKEAVPHFREARPTSLTNLLQRFPSVLSFGTLISIYRDNPKKEFLAVSKNSIDNVSHVHNLVNYLILIEITV